MTGDDFHSPRFFASVGRIFELSLGEMLWSRRSIFLGLLVAAPVILAATIRVAVLVLPDSAIRLNGATVGGPAVFGLAIWLLYIRFVVPIFGVFLGTALIADEVDDKTITYLFVRPIARGAVLLGKYLAFLVCAVLMILPSVVMVYFLLVPLSGGSIGANFPSLVADLGMLGAGLAAYGAVFTLVGARLRRPLIVGLVFIFGWEPAVMVFPGYLKRLTVAFYLQALVPHTMPDDSAASALIRVFREVPGVVESLAVLAAVAVTALWLAVRTVERREYVLEQ